MTVPCPSMRVTANHPVACAAGPASVMTWMLRRLCGVWSLVGLRRPDGEGAVMYEVGLGKFRFREMFVRRECDSPTVDCAEGGSS